MNKEVDKYGRKGGEVVKRKLYRNGGLILSVFSEKIIGEENEFEIIPSIKHVLLLL